MGLDIYLYTAAQAAQNDDYGQACELAWEPDESGKSPWDRMSEAERTEWHAARSYAASESTPSMLYPGHLFNRRYLRSSYNGGGFNHAVPEMLGTSGGGYPNERGSLYWIFEPMGREWDGDDGVLTADDLPKLAECKARALQVADDLRKCDRLRVLTVSPNLFTAPPTTSDDEALTLYRAKLAEQPIGKGDWWSSAEMDVFGDGVSILAAVPGQATFNVPGVHLIYRQPDEGFESYIQSAEIVAEFCDEAAALVERDGSARMSWSG